MHIIELDASGWGNALDFIRALQRGLNAPEWCGSNVDALNELIVWGLGAGETPPPYIVQTLGAAKAPQEVQDHIAEVAYYVQKARREKMARDGEDVDVSIKF